MILENNKELDCSYCSTTLGSLSNSPSALFVASDGFSLRVYQAVIDARTLISEFGTRKRNPVSKNIDEEMYVAFLKPS